MKMNAKELLLFAILFLCLQVSIVSAVDPIVENADAVWNSSFDTTPTDLTNTASTALPRPLIEYPNTTFNFELKECPEELTDNTSKALPRPLIEYPNTAFNFELKECPEELIDNVSKALPRPLVEYPNTVFGFELKECPEELANNASKTLPRPLVEYPNTVLSKSLIFPKELINDTTPPIITNITITNITDNSATIKWNTSEFANSLVKYGTSSGGYTKQEFDELFVKNHSVSLRNLSPGTEYYFVVKSDDRSENSAESSEYSFITTGISNNPIISISTDKYEYTAGERMLIELTLTNPTGEWQPVYFVWRLDLPDYDLQYGIMTKALYLPPDYEQTFTIPFTLGDYEISFNASWYVALYNTTTLEVISEDTVDWKYVPRKKAEGEIIPEEIAKDVEAKILLEKVFMEHFLLEKEHALRKILTVTNET